VYGVLSRFWEMTWIGRSPDERISLTSRSLFLLPVTNADNQMKIQKLKEEGFSRAGVLTYCLASRHGLQVFVRSIGSSFGKSDHLSWMINDVSPPSWCYPQFLLFPFPSVINLWTDSKNPFLVTALIATWNLSDYQKKVWFPNPWIRIFRIRISAWGRERV